VRCWHPPTPTTLHRKPGEIRVIAERSGLAGPWWSKASQASALSFWWAVRFPGGMCIGQGRRPSTSRARHGGSKASDLLPWPAC